MLPFAVSAVSSVISYQRAKAESLGLDAKGGLMERAERIVVLCIGLLIEPWFDGALVWILWGMLVLITITAVQRFVKVWKQAAVAPVTQARIDLRRERRQSRRVARTERRAPACRSVPGSPAGATDTWLATWWSGLTSARRTHSTNSTGALTFGSYRLAALATRAMPGPAARALAPTFGFGANLASGDRRDMIARHLRRADPTLGGLRLRRAVQEAFDFYARYWIESFRLPHLSAREVDRDMRARRVPARARRARRAARG